MNEPPHSITQSGVFALSLAIGLHGLLVIWLSGYVPWRLPVPEPQAVAIQADMVSAQQIRDWAERARLAERAQREAEARRRAEKERQRAEKQKAQAEARARQVAEQKRQAEIAARQRAAEQTRLQAEEQARQQEEAEHQAKAAAQQAAAEQKAQAAEREAAEARARQLAEQKRQVEKAAKQRAAEQARQQADEEARQRAEAERQREIAEREQALQAQYAAVQQQAEVIRVSQLIQRKVARYWRRPPGLTGLMCRVRVRLGETGSVLSVVITESSGQSSFDQSVEKAVWKADPLPMPEAEALRADPSFREHIFVFDPAQHL
ncbi:MAG: cell envelope integrity protein TolA [Pseudomonadota bacterium]